MQHNPTLLFDIGNVVLGIDFHRVFAYWANAAKVDAARFYQNWEADQAYADHETGDINFEAYTSFLSKQFKVNLSQDDWAQGWNSLWTEPFHGVVALLPKLSAHYRLFAFSNTNPTHEAYFRHFYADAIAGFQKVYTSSTLGKRKPHVDAYHAVCADIGVRPESVTFLDDNEDNIAGAKQAGLVSHLCRGENEVLNALATLL